MTVKGKRVLVTGCGGFIGSHLVATLVESGAEVRAFVHYRGNGSWGWLDQSPHKTRFEVVAGDVTRPPKSEVDRLPADNTMVRTILNWEPRIGLDEGLRMTADWIRANLQGYRKSEYGI